MITLLATASVIAGVLLTPFSLLVNFIPLQKLVLSMVGTIGGMTPRFSVAEAVRRVKDLLKYLAFGRLLPNDGFYSPLELAHMVDVRAIFQLVYLTALVSCLLTIIFFAIVLHRQGRRIRQVVRVAGIAVLIVVAAAGALFAAVGFDALFIRFHELAFANDFWLLPEDSGLIRLFPEHYFMSYFFIALGASVVLALSLTILPLRRHTSRL